MPKFIVVGSAVLSDREIYKNITMCVDKPKPTHQNGKILYPTQPNPTHGWIQPTSMSALNNIVTLKSGLAVTQGH